jgi:hypothetical protein
MNDVSKITPEEITKFAIERVMKFYQTDKETVIQIYKDEVDAYVTLLQMGIEDDNT